MATEREMLKELLDDDRLSEEEREAFQDMALGLQASPRKKLSDKQRKWVEGRYEKLDLGAAEALNLHSSGKVPPPRNRDPVFPWEKPGFSKALKPPGR